MEQISLHTEKEIIQQISSALRARRVAIGITQQEAAKRAGLSPRTIQNIETKGIISLQNLVKLLFVYRMETVVLDSFKNKDGLKLDEIKRAEKNVRVRKYGKRA